MKEQHELDRLLKDKFDAREFEFQEAYWQEASGLIAAAEAEGKKPLGFWWRWLVVDSAIVISLLMAAFLFTAKTTDSDSSFIIKNTPSLQTETSQSTHNQTNALEPTPIDTAQYVKDFHRETEFTPTTSSPQRVEKKLRQDATSQTQNTETIKTSSSPSNEKNSDNPISVIDESESVNTNTLSPQKLENKLSVKRNRIEALEYLSYSLEAKGLSPDERLLPPSQEQNKIRKHQIRLVAGLQTSLSFDNSEGKKLSHLPTLGLTYSYALNSRFKLQSGLMLENRSALSLNKAFTSTQFGFGRNEETVTLQPQSVHYLALPLQLGYRFKKRHSISLGLNTGYLLDVRSSLTTQTTDALGNLTEKTENAWGYRQGFQRLNAGMLLGYQFQFSPRLGLILEAYQGFRDLSDDTFWEMERADKQRQVRMKVYWNLF